LSLEKITKTLQWATLAIAMSFILWLIFTGKLSLFIHPRYNLFTAIMVILGAALVAISFAKKQPSIYEHQHDGKKNSKRKLAVAATVLVATSSMFVVAPGALSSTFASDKVVNGGVVSTNQDFANPEGDYQDFTVKDWALLAESDIQYEFSGKEVDLVGFVVPIDENNFYLSRFVVYCCAVDAQPVGVPVHQENWQQNFQENDWVEVQGEFSDTTSNSGYQAELIPDSVTKTVEPEAPYEY